MLRSISLRDCRNRMKSETETREPTHSSNSDHRTMQSEKRRLMGWSRGRDGIGPLKRL